MLVLDTIREPKPCAGLGWPGCPGTLRTPILGNARTCCRNEQSRGNATSLKKDVTKFGKVGSLTTRLCENDVWHMANLDKFGGCHYVHIYDRTHNLKKGHRYLKTVPSLYSCVYNFWKQV
jgi:hypothetical protein